MKVLLAFVLCVLFSLTIQAGQSDLFKVDDKALIAQFGSLTELEHFVSENNEVTLAELQANNNTILNDIAINSSDGSTISLLQEPPLGIPSIIWGFCLGAVGMVIVYIVTESQDELLKSLWGCLLGGVAWVILLVSLSSLSVCI
ncbi:MAG: hypothetical protein IIA45_14225 [Bacteroidetes bacterium]|nr:hypothetical protein [Bacteroidota bacterium]